MCSMLSSTCLTSHARECDDLESCLGLLSIMGWGLDGFTSRGARLEGSDDMF